mmetsp:Transcript_4290/g.9638  ORF Transcript_4290/g.9638 Transcript_4290/m.9638 type:complete len:152 (+) Transcript_4290:618-1073(+)
MAEPTPTRIFVAPYRLANDFILLHFFIISYSFFWILFSCVHDKKQGECRRKKWETKTHWAAGVFSIPLSTFRVSICLFSLLLLLVILFRVGMTIIFFVMFVGCLCVVCASSHFRAELICRPFCSAMGRNCDNPLPHPNRNTFHTLQHSTMC